VHAEVCACSVLLLLLQASHSRTQFARVFLVLCLTAIQPGTAAATLPSQYPGKKLVPSLPDNLLGGFPLYLFTELPTA
jgi:hypothetical protein